VQRRNTVKRSTSTVATAIAFLGLGFLMASLPRGTGAASSDRHSLIEKLLGDVPQERAAALEALKKERGAVAWRLVEETKLALEKEGAREVEKGSRLHMAMQAIGLIRAHEAVGLLVANMDLRIRDFHESSSEKLPAYLGYPALHALIRIGSPSIGALLQTVYLDKNEVRRHLALLGLVSKQAYLE